jgi:hypothetical protein
MIYSDSTANTSLFIRMTLPNGQNSYYQGFTIGTHSVPYAWIPKRLKTHARITPEIVISGQMEYNYRLIRGLESLGNMSFEVNDSAKVVLFKGSG